MRLVLFLGVVVASAAGSWVEPTLGYHDAVGIPLATEIRAAEDKYFSSLKNASPKIVGGVMAATNSHPYLAGLIISFSNAAGQSACGSCVLTANRLVTAAHCWRDGTHIANLFEVVYGSNWLFFGGTRVVTNQVVMHPSWNYESLANDVAVIYMPTSITFSASIQPIALPSTTELTDTFVGLWGIAAGYGKINDQQIGVSTASYISQVTLQVISVAQCQASFGTWAQPSNICTSGAGGVGICGGDSGGPLVINRNGQNILVGISSFVARNGCQLGHPSVFARVTSFYSFIIQNLW